VDEDVHPSFEPSAFLDQTAVKPSAVCVARDNSPAFKSSFILNKCQSMAHDIVSNHLRAHLNQQNPPQRLMIVHGQGGTGKSALLHAISDMFEYEGASSLLAKTATSGVAASIIGGQTLHNWGVLPINMPRSINWVTHPCKETDIRRKKNMGNALWLTIDEMSMLTTPLLVLLSQATSVVRTGLEPVHASIPFRGLNVILLGDFHQFPPVASSTRELYNSTPPSGTCEIGRNLFEQFTTVIKLEDQIRIHDSEWNRILQHSRMGDCTEADIAEIRKLVLTRSDCDIPNFTLPPWDDCILVTSRNSVRCAWNTVMLSLHAKKNRQVKYILYAEDNSKQRPLTIQEHLAIAHLNIEQTQHLPNKIVLVVGMKAMIITNIADILLDPRDDVNPDNANTVYLRFPPAAIIFKPCYEGKK
jgi:hypothetical protein